MRPEVGTAVHKTGNAAELVCSNSLKSTNPDSAAGMLKAELSALGSHLIDAAMRNRVAAGGALAVDRDAFSNEVTARLCAHPLIEISHRLAASLDEEAVGVDALIVATGPLTEGDLAQLQCFCLYFVQLRIAKVNTKTPTTFFSTWTLSGIRRRRTAPRKRPSSSTSAGSSSAPAATVWQRSLLLEIFKIIRGYGGSAVCATQDLNDFFALEDGKYGKGIINNSKTKVILNLEDEEAQRVGSILHLSEAELMEITHFERGSALISTNNNNVAVEIKCSELEKELITTDRRELQELLKRNGKIERV